MNENATDSHDEAIRQNIRASLQQLAEQRGSEKTFCPSEVARAVADDWRPLMPTVREIAANLIDDGLLIATQRGTPVNIRTAQGPIRLRAADEKNASQPRD